MWSLNYTMLFFLNPISYLYMEQETANQGLIVQTRYGQVLGADGAQSREGRPYYEYLGIPFAAPPVGELRYRSPKRPATWDGVRDATSYGSKCSQVHLFSRMQSGSEDCLYLNVHTHQIQPVNTTAVPKLQRLHPVIFHIHGGAFMGGSGNVYGARYMMDQDIVFVTVNYRLASFGFLNAGIPEAQGNMGLKDQAMALRWVQENIEQFGGDPKRVTIVGQSAGGACAHFHMLSRQSRGLFHGAISQSATALAPWVLNPRPVDQAHRFAAQLNCTRPTPEEMVSCLRATNSSDILQVHLDSVHFIHDPLSIFRPTVELLDNEETFLVEHPVKLIKAGKMAQVPFLTGANDKEGLIFAAPIIKNETIRREANTNWQTWAPILFGYDHLPPPVALQVSNRIRRHYLGDEPVSMQTVHPVADMMTDRNWLQGLHNLAELYRQQPSTADKAPLYLYYYSYRGQFSLGKLMFGMTMDLPVIADVFVSAGREWFSTKVLRREAEHYGAAHSDENPLLYHLPLRGAHTNGSEDYDMSRMMVELWTSFATNGKPISSGTEWQPAIIEGRKELKYFHLDRTSSLIDEPFTERVAFWNSLNIPFPNVQ